MKFGKLIKIRSRIWTQLKYQWRHGDRLFQILTILASLSVLSLVIAIGYELWRNSALSRQAFGWMFIITSRWDPALDRIFGALPFIQGTVITSMVALSIAVPTSLGIGIFLSEIA